MWNFPTVAQVTRNNLERLSATWPLGAVTEELANSNSLSSQQKVETIIQYVAVPHCDFWMAAEGYATHDWDDFCRVLRKTYMDVSTRGRYTQDKL